MAEALGLAFACLKRWRSITLKATKRRDHVAQGVTVAVSSVS